MLARRYRSGAWVQWGLTCLMVLLAGCSSVPSSPSRDVGAPAFASQVPGSEAGENVALYALGLVGTPYRYGGNTPAGGFDCSGLIGFVYRSQTGIRLPRTVQELQQVGQPVPRPQARTGDLVLFGDPASHAGVYVGAGRFVHAPSTGGSVRLDRLDGPYWSRSSVAFRRP